MIDWPWIAAHLDAIVFRTLQHLYLAVIAVAIGFAISFPLGVWAARRRIVRTPITIATGILYTVPSLALFAALVPITGLSITTAEIPLVLYTILILFRNVVAGLDAVPADVLDAADGMGFPGARRLRAVEVPLALPLIVAGIRLATVSTIGLVTISGILGDRFGGLGFFIFEGYRRGFATEIVAGALPSILLAVGIDALLVAVQRRLTPWERPDEGEPVARRTPAGVAPGTPVRSRR